MKLQYTSPEQTAIEVTLTENNVLGNLVGPGTFTVPVISGNKEYDEIANKNWKIKDYVAPVIVPNAVTPLQARKALRQSGLYEIFKTKMDAMPEEIQEEWEYCTLVMRDNPLIAQFAEELELTSGDLDSLFTLAATL